MSATVEIDGKDIASKSGFLTLEEATAYVAYSEQRLALAIEAGRDAHIARCEDNLESARWRLRHAEQLATDGQGA